VDVERALVLWRARASGSAWCARREKEREEKEKERGCVCVRVLVRGAVLRLWRDLGRAVVVEESRCSCVCV
jgi:hypothetical protein